jgi:hypothetical protein
MKIEKQTSYKCELTEEENKILENSVNMLSELLKSMNELKCTYADCTIYPECPEGISLDAIKATKEILRQLMHLYELHG